LLPFVPAHRPEQHCVFAVHAVPEAKQAARTWIWMLSLSDRPEASATDARMLWAPMSVHAYDLVIVPPMPMDAAPSF
jgi:hypothetical protein